MSKFLDKISALSRQLFPTGRAFNYYGEGPKKKLLSSVNKNMDKAVNDSALTLDSVLPDNDNFTTDDATRWEERLGMITNTAVSLADRKAAIIVKLNHPGDIPARQSRDYLEDRLRAAGFDVYVHENLAEQTPADLLGPETTGLWEHSSSVEHGTFEHGDTMEGSVWEDMISNSIDETKDVYFNIGTNLKRTFFIGGVNLGDYASVDINRREEFRQLILKIKPIRTVGFLFINYV